MNEIKKLMLEGIVLSLEDERKRKFNLNKVNKICKLSDAFEKVWKCNEQSAMEQLFGGLKNKDWKAEDFKDKE